MRNLKLKFKGTPSSKSVQADGALNTFIQPLKEMPSGRNTEEENADRINAHDLFSHYTADIIKEDTVFAR